MRRLLKLLRNGLNLAYLYSCPEKREAALAAAQVLTPGPAAALTQALILESWALLEAENDLRILEAGEGVAIIKRDENWAVSLENVLALDFSGEEGEGAGLTVPKEKLRKKSFWTVLSSRAKWRGSATRIT